MKKISTKSGYAAYEVTCGELFAIGGLGICDHCNTFAQTGYLVPVLNHWMCPTCFAEWNERAKFYEEDLPFEKKNCAYHESVLSLESVGT